MKPGLTEGSLSQQIKKGEVFFAPINQADTVFVCCSGLGVSENGQAFRMDVQ